MPTSPQTFCLSLLGLLTLAAADVQAQKAPAKEASHLARLLDNEHSKHEGAGAVRPSARSVQATVVRPGQGVFYYWNRNTNRWEASSKHLYAYNTQGRVVQEIEQDSASALNYSRTLYTYNAQGQETVYLRQSWQNNSWVNANRYLTTYDSYGNETMYQGQDWNGSAWINTYAYQTSYTYNAAGQVTQEVSQELENGVWENDDRTTYTFTNGQWSSILFEEWNNGAWQNDERILDIVWHDWATQSPLSYREQTFDGTSFVNENRYSITYGANRSAVELREIFVNGAWFNYRRYTNTNDSQGMSLFYSTESWTNNAWRLMDASRYVNVYNASNALVRRVTQDFDDAIGQYVNYNRESYSNFQTITLAARNAALEAQSALYPNPASGVVTLEVAGLARAEAASGEVRNALGQLVQRFSAQPRAGKLTTQLDLSDLKAGVYTVRLQTSDGAVVKRVVRN